MKIVAMQPYFFPYAGYFRLATVADLFIVLDNVQFTRRSWITRNRFQKVAGDLDWLTLPVLGTSRDSTLIKDVLFSEEASWVEKVRKFAIFEKINEVENLFPNFLNIHLSLLEYLNETIAGTCKLLEIDIKFLHASEILEKKELSGQDYILKLCKTVGATEYINLSGGKNLYQSKVFENAGINLRFLNEYIGSNANILERILNEKCKDLKQEILFNSIF